MMITGPWQLYDLVQAGTDYGVEPLPGTDGDHQTVSGPDLWVLFDHQDANRAYWSYELIEVADPDRAGRALERRATATCRCAPSEVEYAGVRRSRSRSYPGLDVIVDERRERHAARGRPSRATSACRAAIGTAISAGAAGRGRPAGGADAAAADAGDRRRWRYHSDRATRRPDAAGRPRPAARRGRAGSGDSLTGWAFVGPATLIVLGLSIFPRRAGRSCSRCRSGTASPSPSSSAATTTRELVDRRRPLRAAVGHTVLYTVLFVPTSMLARAASSRWRSTARSGSSASTAPRSSCRSSPSRPRPASSRPTCSTRSSGSSTTCCASSACRSRAGSRTRARRWS